MTLDNSFSYSLETIVPGEAHPLALDLLTTLEGKGPHAALKMTSALAAAAILKDATLYRTLGALADSRGTADSRANALTVAMRFVHPTLEGSRDALTRLITSALERGLRMAPSARAERVDPLLHACTDVVELVNALSVARFVWGAETAQDVAVPSSGARRATRDFEAPNAPEEIVQTVQTPAPGRTATRSTMRPSPPRSTMRPTAGNRSATLRPAAPATGTNDGEGVLTPRTQVRDASGRPLKKKW